MSGVTGADADDLERGAGRLDTLGRQIGAMRRPLRHQLHTSPWNGRGADQFRRDWDTVHGPALTEAEEFLRAAAARLRDEARQQREASGSGAGGSGTTPLPPSPVVPAPSTAEQLDELRGLLERLGLPIDKISEILDRLGLLNDLGLLSGPLKWLAENEAIASAIGVAGDVLDVAGLVLDFIDVVVSSEHLPMDERIVLATATVAVGLAVSKGIGLASQFVGGAIGTAIGGPVGTVAGKVVGEIVGRLINEGVDQLDDRYDLTGQVAEGALDAYQFAKERDFDPVAIAVDGAGEVVGNVVEGAQNVVSEVGDAVGDFAEDVWPF